MCSCYVPEDEALVGRLFDAELGQALSVIVGAKVIVRKVTDGTDMTMTKMADLLEDGADFFPISNFAQGIISIFAGVAKVLSAL